MNSAAPLAGIFRTSDQLVPLILDGLSDADARRRVRGNEGPSIVWHLGHLLAHRAAALTRLGVEADNPWQAFQEPASDGADYPSVAEMRAAWQALSQRLHAALSEASAGQLAGSLPGPHGEQTVLDRLAFDAFHEGYHLGSIATIQKAFGYATPPEKIVAAMATGR
ncbi:MAG: DinB family protein [Gemmatimonadota bacterium]